MSDTSETVSGEGSVDKFQLTVCFSALQLNFVKSAYNKSDSHWVNELSEMNEMFENGIPGLNPDMDYEDGLDPETLINGLMVRSYNIHTESFLFSVYSSVEEILYRYCHLMEEHVDIDLKLGDINGRGIDLCKRYLIKVVGISPWGAFDPEWAVLKDLQKVRNSLVHKATSSSNADAIATVLEKHSGKRQLTSDYIVHGLESAEKFFNKLSVEIGKNLTARGHDIDTKNYLSAPLPSFF